MDLAVAIYRAVENGIDFVFVDINRGVETIDQVKREELIGKSVTAVFPGVEEFGLLDVFRRVYRTGVPESHPVSMYTDNRITGWRDNYVYKLETGEIVAVYRDLSEQKHLEESLLKSEEYYRSVFENTGTAIGIVEADMTISRVNNQFMTLSGYEREEVEGLMKWTDFVVPEFLDTMKKYHRDRRVGVPAPNTYVCDLMNKSGQVKHVLINVDLILGSNQSVVSLLDVTERVQTEERLSAFMESATDGFELFDSELNYLLINGVALNRLGYKREEVIGKQLSVIRPHMDDSDTEMYRRFIHVIESGESFSEFLPLTHTGSYNILINVFRVNEGLGIVSTDLTEVVESERALHQSEESYRRLVETSPDLIIVHDLEGKIVFNNKAAADFLGYSAEKASEMSVLDMVPVSEISKLEERAQKRKDGITGSSIYETMIKHGDGSLVPVNIRSTAIIENDKTTGILLIIRNITEQRRQRDHIVYLSEILSAIRNVDQLIVTEKNRETLLQRTCEVMVETKGYNGAWIGLTNPSGAIESVFGAGFDPVRFNEFKNRVGKLDLPSLSFLGQPGVHVIDDVTNTSVECPLRADDIGSTILHASLMHEGRLYGLMMASVPMGMVRREEMKLFEEVVTDISYALYGLEVEESRTQAEEALRRSEDLFRGFMQSASDVFILHDENLCYLEVNDIWVQRTGLKREDVIGKSMLDVFPNRNDDGRIEAYLKVLETGEPVEFHAVESYAKSGRLLDIKAFKTGDNLGITSRDVSDTVKYQRRLEALHSHAASMGSVDTMDEVADITRDSLNEVIGFYLGGLGLVEDDNLVQRYIWGRDVLDPFILSLDGPGISIEAVNTGKTQNIVDVRENSLYVKGFADLKTVSELAVPILVSGKAVGLINIESKVLNAFSEEDQRLVETLASHVASAYSTIKYSERLGALHSFSLDLDRVGSVEGIAETTLRIVKETLGLPFSSFHILEKDELVGVAANGRTLLGRRTPLSGKGLTVRAVNEVRTINVGDVRVDPDFVRGPVDSLSEIDVPIMLEDSVYGVLNVESLELDAFNEDDARLLEVLAQNVASALARIRLSEDKVELERRVLVEQVQVEQEQEMGRLKTKFISTATHELRTPI
ncbi:MAG: PAS domain S-box protein, partial [Chloroflexi bacterium]|nr:PAS domain S-box protein [Chloroflexota bacterium]